MRAISFSGAVVGVASCFVLASACSDFNGAASAEEAGVASDAGDEGRPGVTGTGPDSGADTGAAQDSGTDASTWTPKMLSGLSVWLDSSVDVFYETNGQVSAWKDQSGQANNATLIAPCYDSNFMATVCIAPSRNIAALNGKDTLQFGIVGSTSTFLSVADSPSLQFGTGDFAVFLVARYTNSATTTQALVGELWTKGTYDSGGSTQWVSALLAGNRALSDTTLQFWQAQLTGNQASGATSGLNDGTFRRFGGTRRGNALEAWVNGSLDAKATTASALDVSNAGVPVHVGGALQGNPGGLIGDIAEVVAVKGAVSDADIATLDAYFKAKWGL